MSAVIVRRSVADARRSLLGWMLGMIGMVLMYGAFWPSVRDNAQQFDQYLEALPEFLRNVIGFEEIGTPVGYLQTELFTFLGPALILTFAIGAGARAIAGEEERQTADLLFTTPVTRRRVVVEKWIAMLAGASTVGFALWAAIAFVAPLFGLQIDLGAAAAACLMLVLLGLGFGSIALLIGCWTGRRGLASGATAALAVASLLIDALAPAVEGLGWLQRGSLFFYYDELRPLANGLDAAHASVLAAVGIVALVAAVVAFDRRDVRI